MFVCTYCSASQNAFIMFARKHLIINNIYKLPFNDTGFIKQLLVKALHRCRCSSFNNNQYGYRVIVLAVLVIITAVVFVVVVVVDIVA